MSHSDFFTHQMKGKVVSSVIHTYPEGVGNERIRIVFTDGTAFNLWSYGYTLDAAFEERKEGCGYEGDDELPEDEPAEGNLVFVHQLDDCPFDQSKGG